MTEAHVEVDGRRLHLRNLDKVLYPRAGFTKAEVIDYYARVAGVMLPHLHGRPVTLKRFPDGVDGVSFFEKNCPSHRPPWVETTEVGDGVRYCRIEEPAALVWLANLAALEVHVPMAEAETIDCPRAVVFDLDPGPGVDVVGCGHVALRIRDLFEHVGRVTFPKTSGSKGLQVYLPLNTPTSYEDTTPFAHGVARLLEQRHAADVTSVMKRSERPGKVLIDWSQNVRAKTTVAAYSLRARREPTVSTPVTWDEVADAVAAGDPARLTFTAPDVVARVATHGDLFAAVLTTAQTLPV